MKKYILLALLLSGCVTIDRSPNLPYHYADIDYFVELTTGVQNSKNSTLLTRWKDRMVISVQGEPSVEDLAELNRVVDEINQILGREKVLISETDSNVEIHFVPMNMFKEIASTDRLGDRYQFRLFRATDGFLEKGVVLIADEVLNRKTRNGCIRAGVTRALGFINVSTRYNNSLFYPDYRTLPPYYTELDSHLIRMLYRDEVSVWMTGEDLRLLFSQLTIKH